MVLSDDLRRTRYDSTGRTNESLFESVASGEGGWEAYFEEVFEKVSRDRLDEDKTRYQGAFTFKSYLIPFNSYADASFLLILRVILQINRVVH